jgi:hypothetical protein
MRYLKRKIICTLTASAIAVLFTACAKAKVIPEATDTGAPVTGESEEAIYDPEPLPDEEESFRHGRNSHVSSRRKNIDIQTYLLATGFEAVFGYLYFKEKKDRINELINYIFSVGEIPNE